MSDHAVRNTFSTDVDRISNPSVRLSCQYEEVSVCPMCHTALTPNTLGVYYARTSANSDSCKVFVVHFCPKCRRVFVCEYNAEYDHMLECNYPPVCIAPSSFQKENFSEEIQELSPAFVEIYNQSLHAESLNLMEICGTGYRKALEFLVKDYLCHISPDNADSIKSELLGNSIKRIESTRIKTLAERCAWIGNDETHYVRKHDDVGLDEIKTFITAILHYVESELAFEKAEAIERK